MTFFMYSKYITFPMFRLVEFAEQFHMALSAYERFYEVLQLKPEIEDKPDAVKADSFRGELAVEHVSFKYAGTDEILHDVSLKAEAGRTVALVGESGAGKTTLGALIPRFYEISSGSIKIDGIDIRDYELRSLRKNIGVVRQTPFLFDSTIRDNIMFGNPDAADEEMIEAAKEANIYDFIPLQKRATLLRSSGVRFFSVRQTMMSG